MVAVLPEPISGGVTGGQGWRGGGEVAGSEAEDEEAEEDDGAHRHFLIRGAALEQAVLAADRAVAAATAAATPGSGGGGSGGGGPVAVAAEAWEGGAADLVQRLPPDLAGVWLAAPSADGTGLVLRRSVAVSSREAGVGGGEAAALLPGRPEAAGRESRGALPPTEEQTHPPAKATDAMVPPSVAGAAVTHARARGRLGQFRQGARGQMAVGLLGRKEEGKGGGASCWPPELTGPLGPLCLVPAPGFESILPYVAKPAAQIARWCGE